MNDIHRAPARARRRQRAAAPAAGHASPWSPERPLRGLPRRASARVSTAGVERIDERERAWQRGRTRALKGLLALLEERIVLLDGAMGTMIQRHRLDESGYRGERFRDYGRDLRGNNDLLNLSKPDAIRDISLKYFRAGADIVETNTFNSTRIAQADYGMEALVPELNYRSARLAREVADEVAARTGEPRFVAGALGPTNRTRLAVAGRQRSLDAQRHVRRAGRDLCRRRARPAAGWLGPDPDRDGVRHAECQGRAVRGARRAARSCRSTCP